jgi:hypothetical protein
MSLELQFIWLFTLAIPIACVAWTVTHEEVFRETREYCVKYSKEGRTVFSRKFFYLFTCEYCFSHYVTIIFLAVTNYKLLLDDWRGYLIAGFALVWIANTYMSLFARIKIDLKRGRTEVSVLEKQELKQDEVLKSPERESQSAEPRVKAKRWRGDGERGGERRQHL